MTGKRDAKKRTGESLWREKLQAAGLRSTPTRIAALRHLDTARAPVSHAELVEGLHSLGFDRVTLFRVLNDLSEAGLVHKRDLGDHTWRFELRRDSAQSEAHETEHPHFTCSDCGDVRCLPEESVGLKPGKGVPKAVAQRKVRVTLQGLCDRCE